MNDSTISSANRAVKLKVCSRNLIGWEDGAVCFSLKENLNHFIINKIRTVTELCRFSEPHQSVIPQISKVVTVSYIHVLMAG